MTDILEVKILSFSPVPTSLVLGGNPSSSEDLVGASSHFFVLGDSHLRFLLWTLYMPLFCLILIL